MLQSIPEFQGTKRDFAEMAESHQSNFTFDALKQNRLV